MTSGSSSRVMISPCCFVSWSVSTFHAETPQTRVSLRFVPLSLVSTRDAPLRSALLRLAPWTSALKRSAPLRLASLR